MAKSQLNLSYEYIISLETYLKHGASSFAASARAKTYSSLSYI